LSTELFEYGTCNWCQSPNAKLSPQYKLHAGRWYKFCGRCEEIVKRQIELGKEMKTKQEQARRTRVPMKCSRYRG
jgi:hypothetical protein